MVIAIIGILSSVVMVSLGKARSKARDARRNSDLDNLYKASEMYANDHDDYLGIGAYWCSDSVHWGDSTLGNAFSEYLPKIPIDPQNTNGRMYCYLSYFRYNGDDYYVKCNGQKAVVVLIRNYENDTSVPDNNPDCIGYRNSGGSEIPYPPWNTHLTTAKAHGKIIPSFR